MVELWDVKPYISDFDSLLGQCLGFWFASIAGYTADLEFLGKFGVVEDRADDGPALLASGTEDSNDLGHFVVRGR